MTIRIRVNTNPGMRIETPLTAACHLDHAGHGREMQRNIVSGDVGIEEEMDAAGPEASCASGIRRGSRRMKEAK